MTAAPALRTPFRARPAQLVASLGGIGLLRPGPGSWGSAVVLPVAWGGTDACLALAALLTVVGMWSVWRLPEAVEDPPWIVIDEGAGQALALAALPVDFGWGWLLAAFLAFRVLDVAKPWPISWADRKAGPGWVMADDLIGGAMAALLLAIVRSVW